MTVQVKGKTYKNYRQAALTLGLNYNTVWQRLKAGKSVDEAFSDKIHFVFQELKDSWKLFKGAFQVLLPKQSWDLLL